MQKRSIKIFSNLALGQPIVDTKKVNESWTDAMPGRLKVGDEVMVRIDAFTGELATIHNGRRGKVVAVRYGDIIVNSIDGLEPELKGTHYNPMQLQKLVS
jgi:PHP family Zn ribbon phosphoesterase